MINKQINPKEIVSGFIRIPYEGRGTYGIRFYDVNNKKPISIERPITAIPASGSLLINKENDPPTPLELTLKPKRETINSNAPSRPKITKAAKSKTKNTLGSTKLKGNRPTDDYIVRTGETDIYDDYINAETSRGAEYGHGRKRSSEWNKATALDFRKELEELLKKRAEDSNEFDRQAMK